MKHKLFIMLTGSCVFFVMSGCRSGSKEGQAHAISDSLKAQCIHVLRNVMQTESKWVKVHAAEYLMWAGHSDGVQETFLKEEQLHGTETPYRVGIWRVLYEAANNKGVRDQWTDSLRSVFLNKNSKYRIWAAETMGKLNISPAPDHPKIVQRAIDSYSTELSLYTLWAASNSNTDSLQHCKNKLLNLIASDQSKPSRKRLSAYILRHIDHLSANEWKIIVAEALAESDTSSAKAYMLSAAYVTTPQDSIKSKYYKKIRAELVVEAKSPHIGNRTELAIALAERGTIKDLPILISMMNNKHSLKKQSDNADAKSAAAYGILMLGNQ